MAELRAAREIQPAAESAVSWPRALCASCSSASWRCSVGTSISSGIASSLGRKRPPDGSRFTGDLTIGEQFSSGSQTDPRRFGSDGGIESPESYDPTKSPEGGRGGAAAGDAV